MENLMQVEVLPSEKRGLSEYEWLKSRHSFSFGQYHDLKRLNFGTLRVLNEDWIAPGKGFATHSHDNMEIITIMLDGVLEHKDSMGHTEQLHPGEVQVMTAGSGITHSEYNASKKETCHLLQLWIFPGKRNLTPSYKQRKFTKEELKNNFHPIVTTQPGEETLHINQDALLFLGDFDPGLQVVQRPRGKKYGSFVFVINGQINLGGNVLKTGDSAQVTGSDQFEMKTEKASKLLLIEVGTQTL